MAHSIGVFITCPRELSLTSIFLWNFHKKKVWRCNESTNGMCRITYINPTTKVSELKINPILIFVNFLWKILISVGKRYKADTISNSYKFYFMMIY